MRAPHGRPPSPICNRSAFQLGEGRRSGVRDGASPSGHHKGRQHRALCTGRKEKPEDQVLGAICLRDPRLCSQMKDIAHD